MRPGVEVPSLGAVALFAIAEAYRTDDEYWQYAIRNIGAAGRQRELFASVTL